MLTITNLTERPHSVYPPGVKLEPGVGVPVSLAQAGHFVGREGFQVDCPPDARYVYAEPDGLRLLWASPFGMDEGYSCASEHTLQALIAAGVKASVLKLWFYHPLGVLPSTRAMAEDNGALDRLHLIGICLAPPGFYPTIPTKVRIGITMFESTDPLNWHPDWPGLINGYLSVLVVPTAWQVPVFEQFVTCPIEVAPLAVPLYGLRHWSVNGETFTVGTWGTLTDRKSPAETLAAFQRAFPAREYPRCRLVLKTRHGILGNRSQAQGMGSPIGGISDNRIVVRDEVWLPGQMDEFIASLDCALFLSKGEGFGMPAREAIAAGVPTILAANTGHIEVADPAYTWPVPTHHAEASPMGGEWCIPNLDAATEALCWIYHHREEARQKAARAARWFRKEWGAEMVASRLVEIVKKYGG